MRYIQVIMDTNISLLHWSFVVNLVAFADGLGEGHATTLRNSGAASFVVKLPPLAPNWIEIAHRI